MALDLNEIIVPYKEFSRDATGHPRNIDQMPALLAEGRSPLSGAGVFERRLHSEKRDWKDNLFDTSDFLGYADEDHANELKIVFTVDNQGRITEQGRRVLEAITPKGLVNGALDASTFYAEIEGIFISRSELEKYGINKDLRKDLRKEEVLEHPFWRIFLRHPDAVPAAFAYDNGFMEEVVDTTFAEMKRRFDYDDGMGVYLASAQKVPTLRAACVSWLGDRSGLVGGRDLDYVNGRLVGLAPEALNAHGKVNVGK